MHAAGRASGRDLQDFPGDDARMKTLSTLIAFLVTLVLLKPSMAHAQVEAKINDASKVLTRVDLERVSFALQDLQERALIEGSVQILNKIEEEYPRPVTARDLAVLIMAPDEAVRITVGSELKKIFPETRVNELIQAHMVKHLSEKHYADAITDVLKEMTKIGNAEGGIVDIERAENGKALALVIGICSATVLMFLWMLLFMNKYIGAGVPIRPYLGRIVVAHLLAVLALVAAYVVEIQLGLGIIGMVIIPIVFVLQMALLFKIFKTVLPAVGRG